MGSILPIMGTVNPILGRIHREPHVRLAGFDLPLRVSQLHQGTKSAASFGIGLGKKIYKYLILLYKIQNSTNS
jgi:hypothetical protein